MDQDPAPETRKVKWSAKRIAVVALLATAAVIGAGLLVSFLVNTFAAPSGTPIIIKGDSDTSNPMTVSFNAYQGHVSQPGSEPPEGGDHPIPGQVSDVKISTADNCIVYRISDKDFHLRVLAASNEEIDLYNDQFLWWFDKEIKSDFTSNPPSFVEGTDHDWWVFTIGPRTITEITITVNDAASCTDKQDNPVTCPDKLNSTWSPALPSVQITVNSLSTPKCVP